jgi:hypothetical protein
MKTLPSATATRRSSQQNSSTGTAKSSKTAWQSLVQVNLVNTATTTSKSTSATTSGDAKAGSGAAGIPVNHSYQLGAGSLFLNAAQTPGTKASEPAYALLGLSTSSAPQTHVTGASSGELHFALVGEVTTVPTLSISDSSITTLSIPEPATCGMLFAGGSMLLFGRRRRPARLA